jgi:hypothetical protein
VEETTRSRRTRRTILTRRNRREMKTGRRHLPRKENLMRRRSRDVPGIGASTTWRGATTGRALPTWQQAHQPANQRPQLSCSPSRLGNRPQPRVASPHGQHGLQYGSRLTGQTRMETIDNALVSFHGGGKLKQGTSNYDLPFSSTVPIHPVLDPHQVGGNLP